MNCPNCGVKTDRAVCPECGADRVLYKKTRNISIVLYNKGLAQSKENDITGAILTLTKCLRFNRRNEKAHNVLGLLYSAVGQTGDAIKHWVISVNIKKEDNEAKAYLQTVEQGTARMEKLNDSIKLYNQALIYIQRKNEDMAIIRLKKAVELNPDFVEALNLSAFCYMILKEPKKAVQCVEKVLEIDVRNPAALSYCRALGQSPVRSHTQPGSGSGRLRAAARQASAAKEPAGAPRIPIGGQAYGSRGRLREIVFFMIGTVLSFAVIFIWLVPGAMAGKDKQIAQITNDYEQKEQTYEQQITTQETAISELTASRDLLQTQKDTLDQEVARQARAQTILTAASLLSDEDFEGAAAMIAAGDPSGLSDTLRVLYEETLDASFTRVERDAYSEGVQLYNRGDYETAVPFFEKAVQYKTEAAIYTGNALYYLGRIAEATEDISAARVYYERVLNDYPEAGQAGRAQYQLDRLEPLVSPDA